MRRPKALPHRHVPLPRPTPPAPGLSDPSAPYAPTPTTQPGAPVPKLQRQPTRRPQGTIGRPRHRPSPHPNSATTSQPDRQYGPQKHRLAVSRPPARTRTKARHTLQSRLTPLGRTRQAASSRRGSHIPRAEHQHPGPPRWRVMTAPEQANWEASPSRHPRQMAKPERQRNWQTTQPRRPHCRPSRSARGPWWRPRRKRGGPRREKKCHCQRRTYLPEDQPERGYLAGRPASQKTSTPACPPIAQQTWRHAEAARHRTPGNPVRHLGKRRQTPSIPLASPHQPPSGRKPRVTRAPPHPRPQHTAVTEARRGMPHPGRRQHGAHLEPTRSLRPRQPHPTCPRARFTGERRPADTPAMKSLSTPSWSPAGVPPTRTQRRLPRAATRSHETTMQGAHPSRYLARHTSSAISPPWERKLNTPPPRMTRTRPQAGQRTRPRTNCPGTAPKGAEHVCQRAPTPLASLPTSHLGPAHPGGGGI